MADSVKCLAILHEGEKVCDLVLVDGRPRWFWMEDGRQFWLNEKELEEHVEETLNRYRNTPWWNFWAA